MLRLIEAAILQSSMNLTDVTLLLLCMGLGGLVGLVGLVVVVGLVFLVIGQGIFGRRHAPLNRIRKKNIPKKQPWGNPPGIFFILDQHPSYFKTIDLPDKYETRMARSQPGTCMSNRS